MNLTPSQLETLRETGSVRVVVKMQHQPQQTLHDKRLWLYDDDLYMWGDPPRISNEFIDAASPLPSPGTIETIDGMRCEWVERGCWQKPMSLCLTGDEAGWYWTAIVRRKDDGDE